jgi:hypothetical protein
MQMVVILFYQWYVKWPSHLKVMKYTLEQYRNLCLEDNHKIIKDAYKVNTGST